jgi:[ribosomal protein S18]-alanine N-acetyltransferase
MPIYRGWRRTCPEQALGLCSMMPERHEEYVLCGFEATRGTGDGPMIFEIVPMTLDDIPAAMEIERSSHVQPWNETSFAEELQRSPSRVYVACRETAACRRQLLGYVCFWLVADEVQIFNLTVAIANRRCGIGRALLRQALIDGRQHQARVAVLEVRRSNTAARQLYASLGFQAVGERKDYYGGLREPAVLMELAMDRDWGVRFRSARYPDAIGHAVQS